MARVEIASHALGWLVDASGNPLAGTSATLKNLDGSNATTWSAVTGGTSSTAALTSNSDGTLPRFVEGGQYTLTVGSTTRRMDVTSGLVENYRPSATPPRVQYVAAHGSNSADGLSPGQAKREIQAAVAALPEGGVVMIDPGNYTPTVAGDLTLNGHWLKGRAVAQSSGDATLDADWARVTIFHNFNGDLITFTPGSRGGGLENLLLNQNTTNTGAAIKGSSTAGSIAGYYYLRNLIITGGSGFDNNIVMDGSAHASGIRSLFMENILSFGAASGDNIVLTRAIHAYLNSVDVVQSPASANQIFKVLDSVSEDIQITGKVLGDFQTAAQGGLWFLGRITGTATMLTSAAKNKLYGEINAYVNTAGGSGNVCEGFRPAAQARKTASQSLTSATATAIAWDAADSFDTEAIHDPATNNTRLTVRTAGKYRIYGALVFAAGATGERAIAFRKGGITWLGGDQRAANSTAANQTVVSASTTADLAAGDYVEMWGEQVSGGALNTDASSVSLGIPSHFGMERIG